MTSTQGSQGGEQMNYDAVPFVAVLFLVGAGLLATRKPMGRFTHRSYSTTGPRGWARTEEFWTSVTVFVGSVICLVTVLLFFVLVL